MSFRPFQLRPGEELRPGLTRIAARITRKSAARPGCRAGKAEEAVHELRLLVKLLRTLAWVARPALGREARRRIRTHLRAAARRLAAPRDAAVLASTLSRLARKAPGRHRRAGYAQAAKTLSRNLAAPGDTSVRRKLAAAGRHLRQAGLIFRRRAEKAARPWPSAAQRQRKAARACRRAMKRALSSGRAGDFHEWRKKAKRLLLHWRVTQPGPDRPMRKTIEAIDKLQATLGDHHDLVVLAEHLRKNSEFPRRPGPTQKILGHLHRQIRALEKRLEPWGQRCCRARAQRLKN